MQTHTQTLHTGAWHFDTCRVVGLSPSFIIRTSLMSSTSLYTTQMLPYIPIQGGASLYVDQLFPGSIFEQNR